MGDKVTLLPCPFCGGKASASGKTHFTLKEPDAWWNDGTPIIDAFFCNCTRCGITNQTIVGGYQTQAMAIAEWNRRQALEVHMVRYAWKDTKGRYYTGKGWTSDINKAELHYAKSPVKQDAKEREVKIGLVEL